MNAEHKQELLDSARALITAIEADDNDQIEQQNTNLTNGRDNSLFIEVGKLTRELHAAISNFEIDSRIVNLKEVNIPNTRDRLDYIVNITESAAHRTLGIVDETMPIIDAIQSGIKTLDLTSEEQVSNLAMELSAVQAAFSEITIAQEFQDLTGQVIRQVTDLIEEVETNLVHLITVASKHQMNEAEKQAKPFDPLKAEGPQIDKTAPNVVADQDEVDDLLSSLGF